MIPPLATCLPERAVAPHETRAHGATSSTVQLMKSSINLFPETHRLGFTNHGPNVRRFRGAGSHPSILTPTLLRRLLKALARPTLRAPTEAARSLTGAGKSAPGGQKADLRNYDQFSEVSLVPKVHLCSYEIFQWVQTCEQRFDLT